MKTYFTFGYDHIHKIGDKVFDKDVVAVIEAPSESSAREFAFEVFGREWATSYTSLELVGMHHYPRGLLEVT